MKGIFTERYKDLTGRDWPRRIDPDDLKVLVELGNQANQYGILGGKARAGKARRNKQGKFVKADGTWIPYPAKIQVPPPVEEVAERISLALEAIGQYAVLEHDRV